MARPVAFALPYQQYQQDRIFGLHPDGPVDQAHYTAWGRVRELARERGFDLFTADILQERGVSPSECLLISYDWMGHAPLLVQAGAQPAIVLTLEPPIIAWSFHYHLRRITRHFPHAFVFKGARERVHARSQYHELIFPQVRSLVRDSSASWADRRHLVTIASNKAIPRSLSRWFDRPREISLKRIAAALRYPAIKHDLYGERLRGIAYFANDPEFDLFGQGWQRRHPAVSERQHRAALRAYRGPVPAKLATLRRYRFSLCLENSRFPGYVTEKIFDCFFSGCIPVYLGAPDIADYVPPEAFVDLRRFPDYADLDRFLRDMSEPEAHSYLEAAQSFVTSPAFQRFSQESFAREIVSALEALD